MKWTACRCRLLLLSVLSVLWQSSLVVGAVVDPELPVEEEAEAQFWNRFLVQGDAMSLPSPFRSQPRQPLPTFPQQPPVINPIVPVPTTPTDDSLPPPTISRPNPIPAMPTQPQPPVTRVVPLPWDRPTPTDSVQPPIPRPNNPSPIPAIPLQPVEPVEPLPWDRPTPTIPEVSVPPPTARQTTKSPTPLPTPASTTVEPTPEPKETMPPTPTTPLPTTTEPTSQPTSPPTTLPVPPETPRPTTAPTPLPTTKKVTPNPTTMIPETVSPTPLDTANPTVFQTPENTIETNTVPSMLPKKTPTSAPVPIVPPPTVPDTTQAPTAEETMTQVPLPTPNPSTFKDTVSPTPSTPSLPTESTPPSIQAPIPAPTISYVTLSPTNTVKQQGTFEPSTNTGMPVSVPDTTSPPGSLCLVEVQIDCTNTKGLSCNQITPPEQTTCSNGAPMKFVTFSFTGQTCDSSVHGQGDLFVCQDMAPIQPQPAQLVCRDMQGNSLVTEPSNVALGGTVSISAPNGDDLPSTIDCALFGVDSTMLQQVMLDTSGEINLNLGDTFGAFTLESCASNGSEISCLDTLQYTIDIKNIGSAEMEITTVDISLNGQKGSFVGQLQTNPLPAGQSTSLEPMLGLNVCISGVYATGIDVIATSSTNDICQGSADYSFQIQQLPIPSYGPLPTTQVPVPPIPENTPTPQTAAPTDFPAALITLSPVTTATAPPSTAPPSPAIIIPEGTASPTFTPLVPRPPSETPDTPTTIIGPPGEPIFPSSMPQSPPQAVIPTNVAEESCVVDVTLDCVLASGLPCDEISSPPVKVCSDVSNMTTIMFSYQNVDCASQSNKQGSKASCQDLVSLEFSNPKIIDCFKDNGTQLQVNPGTVNPGQSFTVSTLTGEILAPTIECHLLNLDGALIQVNKIDLSGSSSLELGDTFGALRLESCNALSCRETVTFLVDIINVGDVSTVITKVDMSLNGNTASFVDQIAINPLTSRETTSLTPNVELNICDGLEYRASVSVESTPPSGAVCLDSAVIFIQASTLPPAVSPSPVPPRSETPELCTMILGIDCKVGGSSALTGLSCGNTPSPIHPCLDRPTAMTMLFKGGDCSQSDNTQPETFTCQDFGMISNVPGQTYFIFVQDAYGPENVYFSGIVSVGDAYSLKIGGKSFDSDIPVLIQIFSPDQSKLLQSVVFYSSCKQQNLDLNSLFGGSQLVEFTNPEQGVVSCSQIFSYVFKISAPSVQSSSEPITLTTLTASTNFAGLIDLSSQVKGIVLQPGSDMDVTLEGTVNLCQSQEYKVEIYVEGKDSDGNICIGENRLSFVAGEDLARSSSPISAPTPMTTPPPTSISLPTVPVPDSPVVATPITPPSPQPVVVPVQKPQPPGMTAPVPTQDSQPIAPTRPSLSLTAEPVPSSSTVAPVSKAPVPAEPSEKPNTPAPITPSTSAPIEKPSVPIPPQAMPSGSLTSIPAPSQSTGAPIPDVPTRNQPNDAPVQGEGTPDTDIACEIEAHIACEYLICGVPVASCDQIPNPSNVRCVNGDGPSEIILLNRGENTSIILDDGKGTTLDVTKGETYVLKGPFSSGSVSFQLVCGDIITIDIDCLDNGFGLGDMFGQFELVGFTNSKGSFNSVYEVKLSYFVSNGNETSTELFMCDVHSHFQQENGHAALPCIPPSSPRPELLPSQAFTCHSETVMIDSNTKVSHNTIYNFHMKAIGVNPTNEVSCHTTAKYSF